MLQRWLLIGWGVFVGVSLKCVFTRRADAPLPYKDRGSMESDTAQRKACRFRRSLLGSCSGETDPSFGFQEGRPCLIVKLNRIVNFRPRVGSLHVDSDV